MTCSDPTISNTITYTNLYISPSLQTLVVDAETCGTFVEMYVYTGTNFLTNTPVNLTSHLSNQVTTGGASSLHLDLTVSDIGLSNNIDTLVIVRLVNERTFQSSPPINESALSAAVSYASIYPCLIHKLSQADANCNDCANLNNAMLMYMLMEATSGYILYGRYADAVNTYNRIKGICQEYDLLYQTDPTICELYGGIGCWIIGSTLVVSQSGYVFPPNPQSY